MPLVQVGSIEQLLQILLLQVTSPKIYKHSITTHPMFIHFTNKTPITPILMIEKMIYLIQKIIIVKVST